MKSPFRSLQSKIAAGYVVILVLLIAIAIWSLTIIVQMSDGMNQLLLQNYNSVIASENMVETLERQNSAQFLMFSTRADFLDAQVAKFEKDKEIFFKWFQQSSDNMTHPREKAILDSLRDSYREYLKGHDDLVRLIRARDLRNARSYYIDWILPKNTLMKEKCFRIFEINQALMYAANTKTQEAANRAIVTIVLLASITVLFGMYASWKFTSFIVAPVRVLTETVREIGQGRLDRSVEVRSADEVGQLGEEFNRMTERLRRFETLNIDRIIAEKQKSDSIVASIADPLIVIDAEKRIIQANEASRPLFRPDSAPLIGARLADVIISPAILTRVEQIMRGASSPREQAGEIPLAAGDRNIFYRVLCTPIRTPDGQLIGDVILFQDVTHFKEIDRMKSEFVANVSHELRTPLTSIRMAIDLLLADDGTIRGGLDRSLLLNSRDDCDRLTKMVQDLLNLSRLESGRIRLAREPVDLAALVRAVAGSFTLLLREKGLQVRIEPEEARQIAPVDAEQMRIAISNLLVNAVRFTDPGGSITFTLRRENANCILQIADTGRGISREKLPTIFDKFVQVSGEATPGSVGLGLSIVKEIVEMHGGAITVASVPGEGTTFICSLPLGVPEAERA